MPRSQSAPWLRLVCLTLALALSLSGLSLFFPQADAAAVLMPQGDTGSPDKDLPDLDAQQLINPPTPSAPDPIPASLATWSPYDFDLNAATNPPTVTITSPSEGYTFTALTAVTITATASASAGVSQITVLANGSSIGSSKGSSSCSISWPYFTAGSYTLTAVVRDMIGATATSAPVHITATGGSGAPTVSMTSPANGAQFPVPANITLQADARASSGRSISRVDFLNGGTVVGTATSATSGTIYQFTWSNVTVGTYTVSARATDNTGAQTTSSSITISVYAAAPTVALTTPADGASIPASTSFPIGADASASSGHTIARVDFYANDAPIGTATTPFSGINYRINWSTTVTGTYTLKAVATDDRGAASLPSTRNITIIPQTVNPIVTIVSPSNNQHFQAPASISITAAATAGSGRTISRVDFYVDGSGTPFATDNSSPYNATFSTSAIGSHTITATAVDNQGATGSATVTVIVDGQQPDTNFANARLNPLNRTGQPGEDLYSGNFNWSLPLVGLGGRAGLDLGLSLTYNSLVWTRDTSSIKFNADNGFPAPGFRLGLPAIQNSFQNTQTGGTSYMMILPSGYRIDLRRVGSTSLYESADSSYMQFDTSSLVARTSDGTQLSFILQNQEYRCTQVKDCNGNYITAAYDGTGHISSITDTLGRVLSFEYDAFGNLQRITQPWNGVAHAWATFGYINQTLQTNFTGLSLVGITNGTSLPMLTQVGLADGSRYVFTYNTYFQVYQITHYAPGGGELSHMSYDLPRNATAPQTDCPRFTSRKDFADHWNEDQEVATSSYYFAPDHSYTQVTLADGTIYKEFFVTSGYRNGLATQTEFWSGGTRKKWATTAWTQDNTALSYPLNPRPQETNVYDDAGNRRRVVVTYQSFTLPSGTSCALPITTDEYAADGTTVLRRSQTYYGANMGSPYVTSSRRIIGLPDTQTLYEGAGTTLVSKVDYQYDLSGYLQATPSAAYYHDDAGFGIGFLQGRGNLCVTRRYDVSDPNNQSLAASFSTGYDTAGNVVFSRDPLSHATSFSYLDNFAQTQTPGIPTTLAYPTTVTDPNNYSVTAQYDYDLGAVRRTDDPKGAYSTTLYDNAGRVSRVDISNGAYTRYVYDTTLEHVDSYTRVDTGLAELYSLQQLDGVGRMIGSASTFPNSTGGYRAVFRYYDVMGRVSSQSNPTEITTAGGQWLPVGDDAGGWIYTLQSYDWKGRPLRTTNPDNTFRQLSYGGCGCAGGEQVTSTDESGRQQRTTYDVLGRVAKTESFNANGTVYATTGYTYNGRDQATRVRQYQGSDTSPTYQDTLMTYDGHGRLQTRKLPAETYACQYTYYADDTLHVKTDPRSATAAFTYNERHLVTNITYTKPLGSGLEGDPSPNAIPRSDPVNFDYDGAGNRLWMTDGQGRTDYVYDTWSRLQSETRQFNDIAGQSWPLSYTYTLTGQLKSMTDAFGQQTTYTYNQAGELTTMDAPGVTSFLSTMRYRAWGALKAMSYGNGLVESASYNARLQMTLYDLRAGGSGTPLLGYEYRYDCDGSSQCSPLPNDGRVRYARDTTMSSSSLDRSYSYDQVGRLVVGKSGSEARNEQVPATGPYNHSYGYDAFGNMNSRGGRAGYIGPQSQPISYSATYVNDRNNTWSYNDAGQVVVASPQTYQYDAAGQMVTAAALGMTLSYDGDGRNVKRLITDKTGSTATYYVRSSVLGGQVVNEMGAGGGTRRTYLFANGRKVGRQKNGNTYWVSEDAATLTYLETDVARGIWSRVQMDPLGVVTATGSPTPPPGGTVNPQGYLGVQTDPGTGCRLDGAPFPCDWLTRIVNAGSAVKCPNGDCGPRPIQDKSGNILRDANGDPVGWEWFRAYADGFSGWLPVNAVYSGGAYGRWHYPGSDAGGWLGKAPQRSPQPEETTGPNVTTVSMPMGPTSDCGEFVDLLMAYSDRINLSGSRWLFGGAMAVVAKNDLAKEAEAGKLGVEGFRPELIAGGQGGWAQVHVLGMAGAYLAGYSDRVASQFKEDRDQLQEAQDYLAAGYLLYPKSYGKTNPAGTYPLTKLAAEKMAEIKDDEAGVAVGTFIHRRLNGDWARDKTRIEIFNRLCDH